MQIIPLQPFPSQTIQTVLDGDQFQIAVYQKMTGVFVDISVNGVLTNAAVLAVNGVPLMIAYWKTPPGNLLFVDTQGQDDPEYTGLGARFQLAYLTADEYLSMFPKRY